MKSLVWPCENTIICKMLNKIMQMSKLAVVFWFVHLRISWFEFRGFLLKLLLFRTLRLWITRIPGRRGPPSKLHRQPPLHLIHKPHSRPPQRLSSQSAVSFNRFMSRMWVKNSFDVSNLLLLSHVQLWTFWDNCLTRASDSSESNVARIVT